VEQIKEQLLRLQDKICRYGKENLEEMLFATVEGICLVSDLDRVRIYLEDLTSGALSCVYASGPFSEQLRKTSFPIVSNQSLVSTVFANQSSIEQSDTWQQSLPLDRKLTEDFSIAASYLLPIVSHGRSIGVICIDSNTPGEVLADSGKEVLTLFVKAIATSLDGAKKYQQQILLTRRVEEYKKREAAAFMVKSAVQLIDRLSLASVLVPTIDSNGKTKMEVLASYSADPRLKALYDDLGSLRLGKGSSLVARFVGDDGLIADDQLLKPLFISDLTQQTLQKRALTEKMSLRSLYMVPRYEPATRKIL